MKKAFLLVILIYFHNGIAVLAQQMQERISIDVGKKTKPLDPLLWKGNYFDEKAATALLKDESEKTSIWKKIPTWQAGNWERTQETNTKAVLYINGQPHADTTNGVCTSKYKMTLGWQKDKNGDIWQWFRSGYWTMTEYDDWIAHAFVKFSSPGTDDYPDCYAESINFSVDKSSNKILHVWQSKSWRRFVYLAPDLFKEEAVHTTYDEKGSSLSTAWNTELNKRIQTFAEYEILLASDPQQQQEIQKDFFNYLKNNSLADLIPTGAGVNETATKIMSTH